MMKFRLTLLAFLFSFIFSVRSYPQTYLEKEISNLIKENSQADINNFILDKAAHNRIVMIADEGHGNYIFLRTVVNFLNHWIETFQKDQSSENFPRNLYLILECDSSQLNSIYRYFSNHNPYELLKPEFIFGYQFTSAILEFYDDFKKNHYKIDSINGNLSDNKKISLKLFGPEKVIDLSDWSTEKRDKYFVSERDEYSSDQIINLLEKDTTYNAVIFYGGAHLITIKTQKLNHIPDQGYYMGSYLQKHFKDKGGYYSIDQISAVQNPWLNNCYKWSDQNYVIENSIFNGHAIPNNVQPQFTDASIILFDNIINQKPISQIWSLNLADCFLNNYQKYSNQNSEFHKGITGSWLYYLANISGEKIENINYSDSAAVDSIINYWKNWRAETKINIAEEIINQVIIKNKIKMFEDSEYPAAARFEYELGNMLNAKVWYGQGASPAEKVKSYYDHIQKYSKPIIAENLINLLWIGTEEERTTAAEYLKKNFSLNYDSPKQWTEWWRNSEYCNF